jgi:sporulation protein YlmC with PRC-barrel domain
MKSHAAVVAVTLFLAGCTCADPQMRSHSASRHSGECGPRTASLNYISEDRQPRETWQVGKLLKARVRDRDGKDVAQIEDMRLAPDGRISSVVVRVDAADGKMVTVPFSELKRSVDRNGDYVVQTSFNLKPPAAKDAEKPRAPEEKQERAGAGKGEPDAPAKDDKAPKK